MTWTRDDVLKASDEWVWVPPGAERLSVDGVDVIDYPDWARMGFYVMPTTVTGQVDEVVDRVQEMARSRGRKTSQWWISPTTSPASLEETLCARGAELTEQTDIVAYDMSSGLPATGPTPRVRVELVSDAETLDAAEQVASAVWGGEPSSGDRRRDQLRSLGDPLDAEGGFRVIAYLDDRPVSTGGCQVVGAVARLYGACTLPEARGKGGYRAVLKHRLEVARAAGATLALVHARVHTSGPILQRLGFTACGEGRQYSLR